MFGLKVNRRFLDLKPGTSAEIERKSPVFSTEDYASEGTTSSLAFPYTPNNALALDLPYQYYTERRKKKFEAEYYEGNSFRGRCTLIIVTGTLNVTNIEATEISGDVVFGLSHFFQEIKGKKLTDLRLGGNRIFSWTTNNPGDGSNGFWQHIHATWTDASIPYVFAPVRNEKWFNGYDGVDWMNGLDDTGKIKYSFLENPIVPMIRIKYLVEQIFLQAGWEIDFSGLNDADWQKLILVSTKEVAWYDIGFSWNFQMGSYRTYTPNALITIHLSKHLPANKTISDFILQLFFKYGWMPVFNLVTKKCRYVAAKELRNGQRKDWSPYASPSIATTFNEDEKIFAYNNDIDSNDQLPSAPDFTGVTFGAPAATVRYLPAPTADQEGIVIYCVFENKWVKATPVKDSLVLFEWTLFADNIYSIDPGNATDTISTTISTLPIYLTLYRKVGAVEYFGFFPMMEQDKNKEFGYRTLLFHGMVPELDASGNAGAINYPFASSLLFDSVGNQVTAWSDVLSHKINAGFFNEIDKGTVNYWLKTLVEILKYGEEVQVQLNLPLQELQSFEWDNIILIRNIPYLVKSTIETSPFTGQVQATMRRLVNAATQPDVLVIVTPPMVITPFYAHIAIVNVHDDYGGVGPYGGWSGYKSCDIVITLFADAAGTVPYTPLTPGVTVVESGSLLINGSPAGPRSIQNVQMLETSLYLLTRVMHSGTATSGEVWTFDVALDPDPAGHYTVI